MTETRHAGACHCAAVLVTFTTRTAADALQVRACQCSFCRRQGAMTVSDPAGSVVIEAAQGRLNHYQFATRTASSLVCTSCGTYIAAFIEDGTKAWTAINVRGLQLEAFTGRTPQPMVYDQETAAERTARRKLKWTPAEIRWRYYY